MKSEAQTQRQLTITWEDPEISTRDGAGISGLDYLRSIKEGKIQPPPAAKLIGYRLLEIEPGRTVFGLEPAEYHFNPFTTVHGGIVSTLLDTTMISTILSTLAIGFGCSTLELKVNFVRPIRIKTGLIRCEGRIIHMGKTIGIAEGRVTDQEERLYAYGVCTSSIFKI